ncbi:MAG: hypothetical protein VKP62_01960 [Candidatus Sericytochromatia bacterium]|nr:hypothetical protein [Candidatus Sericytochromatia bacterium]
MPPAVAVHRKPERLGWQASDQCLQGVVGEQALAGKLSFCDFCPMHHEHEAFQTGNQVVGALTGWKADTRDMGVWRSQFDAQGRPRLDLLALARQVGPAGLLAAFNERERGQFLELGGSGERGAAPMAPKGQRLHVASGKN